MKALFTISLLIFTTFCFAQNRFMSMDVYTRSNASTITPTGTSLGIVTANIPLWWQTGSGSESQWHTIDTLECGVDTCAHQWVHSKPWQMGNPNIQCAVMHPPGFYCNYGNAHQRRKSICRKCCFHVLESDEYVPTPSAPAIEPEYEYEKLVKKQ